MKDTVSATPSTKTDSVRSALEVVYKFDYSSELEDLRRLYDKGLARQWVATRDLPWNDDIDQQAFSRSFSLGSLPLAETSLWHALSGETRWEVARRGAAFMLSNFLHGEQGALMVAGQLVSAVPHIDGKFYAATQTLDEARHVEVFAKYITKLDRVYSIAPALKTLLDEILAAESWMMKCVGMQIVVEGLALYTFRDMRETTCEPLLKKLLTYVSQDEARHTAYGIKYLAAVVPSLTQRDVAELEDFAFETSRLLIDSRRGLTPSDSLMDLLKDAGLDPNDVIAAVAKDRDKIRAAVEKKGGRIGPLSGFVIPTLKSIGLFSERLRSRFHELFDELRIEMPRKPGQSRGDNPVDVLPALPEDLDAWAAGTG